MTTADEKNDPTKFFKCELGCRCLFLTKSDLEKHYQAFKRTGVAPNRFDHINFWKDELEKRKHESHDKDYFE